MARPLYVRAQRTGHIRYDPMGIIVRSVAGCTGHWPRHLFVVQCGVGFTVSGSMATVFRSAGIPVGHIINAAGAIRTATRSL